MAATAAAIMASFAVIAIAAASGARAAATASVGVEVRHKDDFTTLRSDFDCGLSVPDGGGVGGVRGLPTCNVRGIRFEGGERAAADVDAGKQNVLVGLDGTAACPVATNAAAYVCDGARTSVWARESAAAEHAQLVVETLCDVNSMALRLAVTAPAGTRLAPAEQLQVGVTVGAAAEHVVALPAGARAATLLVSSAAPFADVRLRVVGDAAEAAGAGVCVSHVAVPCCAACGGDDDSDGDGDGDGNSEQEYGDDNDNDAQLPPRGGCCAQPYAADNVPSRSACPPPKAFTPVPLVCNDDTTPLPDAPTTCDECVAPAERRPACMPTKEKCSATDRSGCACAACANIDIADCAVPAHASLPVDSNGFVTPAQVGGKTCIIIQSGQFKGTVADFDCVIIHSCQLDAADGEEYVVDFRDAAPGACVVGHAAAITGLFGRSTSGTEEGEPGDYYGMLVNFDGVRASDGADVIVFADCNPGAEGVLAGDGEDFVKGFRFGGDNAFALLDAGGGNDVVELDSGNVDTVLGGAGLDSMSLANMMVDSVQGGDDPDCIVVESVGGSRDITGDAGVDSCVLFDPPGNCFLDEPDCEQRLCSDTQC